MARENRVTGAVLNAALSVHRELGPGLLESVFINFNVNLLKDGVTRVTHGASNLRGYSAASAPPREIHE